MQLFRGRRHPRDLSERVGRPVEAGGLRLPSEADDALGEPILIAIVSKTRLIQVFALIRI